MLSCLSKCFCGMNIYLEHLLYGWYNVYNLRAPFSSAPLNSFQILWLYLRINGCWPAFHGKLRADLVIIEGQCNYGLSHKMTSKIRKKLRAIAPKKGKLFLNTCRQQLRKITALSFDSKFSLRCPHHDDKVFLAEKKTLLFGIMVYSIPEIFLIPNWGELYRQLR